MIVEKFAHPTDEQFALVDTREGVVWLGREGVRTARGTRPFPRFPAETTFASLPMSGNGRIVFQSDAAMWVWDPFARFPVRFHSLWNGNAGASIDAKGRPVGFLNRPGQRNENVWPMRGRTPLRAPPGAIGGWGHDQLKAAARGTAVAGTLTLGPMLRATSRACLWTDDLRAPGILPLLPGCGASAAYDVNTGGDVFGLQWKAGTTPGGPQTQTVVWHRDGTIERVPLAYPERAAETEGQPDAFHWRAQRPVLLTDSGLVVASEGTVAGGLRFRTFPEGGWAVRLAEAIGGAPEVTALELERAWNGSDLLILGVAGGDWVRVRRH